MRGRKPKPIELRVIEGNPGKREIPKNRARPPVSVGLTPPSHLNPDAKRHWKEMSRQLEVLGLLAAIDRGALAVMCQNYGVWAQAERTLNAYARSDDGKKSGHGLMTGSNGGLVSHPMVAVARRARADYLKAASEFGMTPTARSRVDVGKAGGGPAPPASKFAGMIGGKGRA